MRTKILGTAVAALILTVSAYGTADFTFGNHPQPNEENIMFHSDQMGMTIDASTTFSGSPVQFSSTLDTLIGTGGQSDVDSSSGLIHDITMTVPGKTFLDAIINPFKPVNIGDLMVSVVTSTGRFGTFPFGSTTGDNFLTITATGGETIDSVTIDSAGGFQGLKQPRISGIPGVVVPEPSSLALLGSGVLGLAAVIRRKLTF
ncbi:MAG TPA: PEP-CTERM sorting domain-containing protein [Terriglobales bacterium]